MYEVVKERFRGRNDVVFLPIDTDEDQSLVEPFLAEQKWDKSVYFEDGLARVLNVTSIPTTILFDKEGRLASRMNGFVPDTFVEQLTERVQATLGR
jgi:thioredoxin-related protein